MTTRIELVAFDLGNVLCTVDEITPSRELASLTGLSWESVHDIVFGQSHKLMFESGKMSFARHAEVAIEALGVDMSVEDLTALYDSALIPSEEMFSLVAQIAETRRIALVSNTSEPHWKSAKKFLPFSSQLDPVIVSYEVEAMKPQPRFYAALLEQSDVPAERILFVDDLPVNIEGATSAGMTGHLFSTKTNFESSALDLGLL